MGISRVVQMTICFPFLVAASLAAGAATGKVSPAPAAVGQHVAKVENIKALTPHVRVTRQGRLLRLDYELLDAGGKKTVLDVSGPKPHFQVFRDGQQLAAGDFEYG
jgi:hypothetical protein